MASKSAVKAIKACIDRQDYQQAVRLAQDVTKEDPKNHSALLFLGFGHEKLGNVDAAEKALSAAASLKPQDVQALKGLVTLYEKQGSLKLDQYHQTAHQLARIYAEQDNRDQCQGVVDKYELFVKKHGSQSQYRKALELILPDSDLYATLEGRVLSPALAYLRILESAQAEESDWIETQIAERRTRLGARIDQVTQDVKREAIPKFQIETKYEALIHWTRDDEVRHELEQQHFQRLFDNLVVLPVDQKPILRDRLLNIANGMVIIKQQFAPAWKVALEWVDAEELGDWDVSILREYIALFPDDGLSKVLRGFLDSPSSPFPLVQEEQQPGEQTAPKLSEAEQLILMNDGLDDCPESLLAHRILAHVLLHLEEYESAADMARKAQKLHHEAERKFALDLLNSLDGVNLTLANALIYYQSPRHHSESKSLFEAVLTHKPTLTSALLGVGLIYEEDEDYAEAAHFLARAAERDEQNLRIRLELAWCKALSQDFSKGLEELQEILSVLNAQEPINLSMKAETLYRIGYCKWHVDSSPAARKNKNGPYKDLIDAVKANPSYAPAYTLLGIYFQDYGKSKQRARVALQKAFELSTSELQAAERLARLFADRAEWDLVELVAQRVISSGKATPAPGSKKQALSWPYSAMGIVQINKQHFAGAIVSFQTALRIQPDDYHSWVGLGESYHNSGRYIAASKAFEKAESINQSLPAEQTWLAKYMLANVHKEMGDFDKAIELYRLVLENRPGEHGVLVALLQTLSENAWSKIAQGMFGQAADLAATAVTTAIEIAQQQVHTFNLWKAVGDACSALAHVRAYAARLDFQNLVRLLTEQLATVEFELLQDQDKVTIELIQEEPGDQTPDSAPDRCLLASIMAHKRAIHACADDRHAQAVSWFNLGSAQHQAYVYAGASLQIKGHQPRRFIKAAIRCFKRAIELEAGNSEFWNALGLATMTLNPQVSQHSFVRSLHLNEHSARTWTNLGVLYLVNNDVQLANLAFTRAQSADPEYADAWIGQGLLATLHGTLDEARALFTHAFAISDSGSLVSKRHYTLSAFDHLLKASSSKSGDIARLLEPLFAARQLHVLSPSNVAVTHLMALYAERAGDFDGAASALSQVCDSVEAQYEESESESTLVRFAQAKSDLARVQLANGEWALAADNAQTALALAEEISGAAFAEQGRKLRLSANITAGLAHSHLKAIEQSIKMFQAALSESGGNPDIVCMLAQVLWAKGGQAEKEAAQSQLFDSVSDYPRHVRSILLLATIGLLEGDSDIVEAVVDDLQGLLVSDDVSEQEKTEVTNVVAAINACNEEDASKALTQEALRAIMLSPAQPRGWLQLALGGNEYAADVAKANSLRQMPPHGLLDAAEVSQAFADTGAKEDRDQAKMLAPWLVGQG